MRPCSPSCAPGRPCTSSWGSRRNGASVRCRVARAPAPSGGRRCAGSGAPPSRTRPARASGVASRRRWCLRSREGHAPVPRSLMSDPLVRGTTHAVVTPGLLAVARPLKASRPPFHTPLLTRRPRHRGSGDVPRRSVAHDPVPRRGVRRGVRHLRVLLPGTGVLREGLSRVRTTAAMPGRQRATSAQRDRSAGIRPFGPSVSCVGACGTRRTRRDRPRGPHGGRPGGGTREPVAERTVARGETRR